MVHYREKYSQEEVEKEKQKLKELLEKSNYKVYTILKHVSSSGMQREISPIIVVDGEPINISYSVGKVLDRRLSRRNAVVSHGAGMDMGFELVYALSQKIYGHENQGGYKLKQYWL